MFEQRSGVPPAEPGPTPAGREPGPGDGAGGPTAVQVRLQILSTEHWSLLASRSLAWNESFARAGMYLSTLSGSMVALGLIAGVAGFGDAFFIFGLVILPVVLFVGIGTWLRLGAANYHDARTVYGMNRIRGAYLEIAPDLGRYFVMGVNDDPMGIGITMAVPPGSRTVPFLLSSTPFLIVVLNGVVAGSIAAMALVRFVAPEPALAVAGGLVAAVLTVLVQMRFAVDRIKEGQAEIDPLFPTPAGAPGRVRGRSAVGYAALPAIPTRPAEADGEPAER